MARYIDADALIKQMKDSKYVITETPFQRGVNASVDYWIAEIKHFPEADVVPRAEVEKIVEEVEKTIETICAMTGFDVVFFGRYAELKKKYTKGENE